MENSIFSFGFACVSEVRHIWCIKVSDYYVYTPQKSVTPIISEIKGNGLRKRKIKEEHPTDKQSQINSNNTTDQLIDHAKALIDTAKTFVTKPVGHKHGTKQPTTSPVGTGGKPKPKPKALDMLHGQTLNNLATLKVGTDGTSDTNSSRKIKCKICTEILSSFKELNTHHQNDHGIVSCTKCDKTSIHSSHLISICIRTGN